MRLWHRPVIDAPPVPGASFPIDVDPVDEPDGGTFYRPPVPNWINRTTPPNPDTGDEGDYALDTEALQWYGPKGEEDEDPESETYGEGEWPGPFDLPTVGEPNAWIVGAGEPDNETDGDDGDYYLDTSNHAYYGPKAGGLWDDTGPVFIVPKYIEIDPTGRTCGLFEIPSCAIGVGNEESETVAAVAFMETVDADGKQVQLIEIANLSADGGPVAAVNSAPFLKRLRPFAAVRWIISGDEDLTWTLSGGIVWRG